MKKWMMILLCSLCTPLLLQAQVTQDELDKAKQEVKEATKDKKKKDKEYRKLLEEAWAQNALTAIEENDFVIEAERIAFKRGRMRYVTASTNFIAVKGDRATVQIAFEGAPPGPNGLGGITVEGTISDLNKKTDKKGNSYISMLVMGSHISARVTITLAKGTHRATAVVLPNFSSNRFTLHGYTYPTAESNIFKGRTL